MRSETVWEFSTTQFRIALEIEPEDMGLVAYVQTDPRGASLYILRAFDIPAEIIPFA